MKVEFAPLNVPLRRRLQTAAALQWVFSFLALAQCCLAAFVLLALSDWWMLALLYAGWLWLDWDTPTCGGRRSQWVRSWSVWDYFRDYFPLRLIKSVDLDPKKNYIFGFHPHGVLVAGAFGNFCTEATGFSRLFPGLRSHLLMLPFWFRVPVFRDYIMCGGSAEKTSIQKVVIKSFISSQREVVMQSTAQLRRETVVHRLQAVPCLHITPEPRPEVRGFLRVGSIPYLFNHFNGCATPEYLITVPICAELLGLVSSCKSSLSHLVSRPAGGNVAVIAVGGAPEALDARPGALTLQVRNRKGFIKLALKHGAHLVPVFSFGENELFDQVENPSGSPLRKLQNRLQSIMGVAMPLFHARGVFQYSFGLMPYRKPIHTVVGKPISVVQTPSPSCEDIECLHKLYMQNLTELFEQHKHNYGLDKQQHLTFI